jgi:4-hydroxybenzoate polyprenyltransferase
MWGRAVGGSAAVAAGGLLLVSEEQAPAIYSIMFYAFVLSILGLIVLTIYTSRFKRRHGIHRHG